MGTAFVQTERYYAGAYGAWSLSHFSLMRHGSDSAPPGSSGDHTLLSNRFVANQHVIPSITGLTDSGDGLQALFNDGTYKTVGPGSGDGDVTGPDGGVKDNELVSFDGTTGKQIAGGVAALYDNTPLEFHDDVGRRARLSAGTADTRSELQLQFDQGAGDLSLLSLVAATDDELQLVFQQGVLAALTLASTLSAAESRVSAAGGHALMLDADSFIWLRPDRAAGGDRAVRVLGDLVLFDAADNERARLIETPNGLALAYSKSSSYDPNNGAVNVASGLVEMHGAQANVQTLADDVVGPVWSDSTGNLFGVEPPDPGWEDGAISAGVTVQFPNASPGAWVLIPGLQTIIAQDVVDGDPLDVTAFVHLVESSGNQSGTVEMGFGINGADPLVSQANKVISGGFEGYFTAGFTIRSHGGLTAGQTVDVYMRVSEFGNVLFDVHADGSTFADPPDNLVPLDHEAHISVPAEGGAGTGEVNVLGTLGIGQSINGGKILSTLNTKSFTGSNGITATSDAVEVDFDGHVFVQATEPLTQPDGAIWIKTA